MKYLKNINKLLLLLSFSAVLFTSCGNDACVPGEGIEEIELIKADINPSEITHKFIKASGEYIVSNGATIISADDVYENLGSYLVIDLRRNEDYVAGHVNGAINVALEDLIDHMNYYVAANAYDKIVFTCYSGQSAAFAAGAMRTIGYNNIYSMKYGMNAWSNKNLNKWGKSISNKYAGKLETKENKKPEAGNLPEITSEAQLASEILTERATEVLTEGFDAAVIKADEVFANTDKYYIINYWPQERYSTGHIPGSVQYTQKKDLKMDTFLNTIPTDKPVVVYCYTGQMSASTVAYLRILGYDAKSLTYGANSFMNTTLINKGWAGYTAAQTANNYPMTEGENPTDAKAVVSSSQTKPKTKKKVIRREKKAVSGGCG